MENYRVSIASLLLLIETNSRNDFLFLDRRKRGQGRVSCDLHGRNAGFNGFSKEILYKSMIFRSPASRRLGLERPGLQKSSISFKFLLKIDDFRRRVEWEKPGVEKPSIFIRNPFGILKSIQRDFQRISMVFGSLASPSRPGVENPRFSKGI